MQNNIFLEAMLLQWIMLIAYMWVSDWETWRVNTGNYLSDLVLLLCVHAYYERLLVTAAYNNSNILFYNFLLISFELIFDFCETLWSRSCRWWWRKEVSTKIGNRFHCQAAEWLLFIMCVYIFQEIINWYHI